MAGKPIVIEFSARVRDFIRGTRDVERATEDIADELQAATKDAERFEREFEQSMRDAERAADKSSRNIEKDFDRAGDEMAEVGREAGDEFQQNLGESLSSGNLEDIFTDTLGGLVGSLKGPLGAAAAALAGVAALAFHEARQEAEKIAEFVDSIASAVDDQFDALEGRMSQLERTEQFSQWAEDNKDTLYDWSKNAELAAVNMDEFANAAFFGGEQSERMKAALQDAVAAGTTIVGEANPTPVMDESARAAQKLLNVLEDTESEVGQVREKQQLVNEALDYHLETLGKLPAAAQRVADRYQQIFDTIAKQEIDVEARIHWYNVGPGKAYVDPSSAGYSPGHVAVSNLYNKAG